jgi:hypothetical protein
MTPGSPQAASMLAGNSHFSASFTTGTGIVVVHPENTVDSNTHTRVRFMSAPLICAP